MSYKFLCAMDNKNKPIILVVDDDELFSQFVKYILEKKLQANVYNFNSPKGSFDFLENQIPDLILLDMEMPIMDGYTFMRKLRSNPKWAKIHVIPCTAIVSRELFNSLLQLGIDDYILKPVSEKTLVAKISEVLARIEKID